MQSREGKVNNHLVHENDPKDTEVPDLTLSLNLTPNNISSPLQFTSAFDKQLFGCRNCTRVFFSSQALGGHMNAHRKEAKPAHASKRYHHRTKNKQPRKTAAVLLAHSSSGPIPALEKAVVEPIFDESDFRVPYMHGSDSGWPGSFQGQGDGSNDEIDLNLRL